MEIVDGRKTRGHELVICSIKEGSATCICPEKIAMQDLYEIHSFLP